MKNIKLLVAIVMALFLTASLASANENALLESLETIKANIEQGVDYQTYKKLVTNCKVKMNIYTKSKKRNKCFTKNAQLCFNSYEEVIGLWSTKINYEPTLRSANVAATSSEGANSERIKEYLRKLNTRVKELNDAMQKSWANGDIYLEKAYNCL